ncbi:MAG: ABC-type zinc uptake system zinc chaperone [Shewanella sp.]
MRLKSHIRRTISIWLSAILILLSFAASAHSVTHIDDGTKAHCTLCFHHHQLSKILLTEPLTLNLVVQHFEPVDVILPSSILEHVSVYRSRAPPFAL